MDFRLRASPRHDGARKFILFFILLSHQSAAAASLREQWHSSYLLDRGVKIPAFSLNTPFFSGNRYDSIQFIPDP
jgi:hypothetical protein